MKRFGAIKVVVGMAALFTLCAGVNADDVDPRCYTTKMVEVDSGRVDRNGNPIYEMTAVTSAKPIHIDLKRPDILKAGSEVTFDASGSTVPSGEMEARWTDFHPEFKLVSATDFVQVYKAPDRASDFNGKFTVFDKYCKFSSTVWIQTIKVR
jgi:hypothetical protein